MDLVGFGIILDDIVFPNGDVRTGLLGGGGPQTAFGMRLWAERVGLVARVGPDMPETAWAWLEESEIDTRGVKVSNQPTLRAWQWLKAGGRRVHEWKVPADVIRAQLAHSLEDLPPDYRQARGWHLGLHPEAPDLEFLAELRALGGVVSVEPFRPATRLLSSEALSALVRATDIFSPNLADAQSLVGPGDADEVAQKLIAAGASVVTVRLGKEGSLAWDGRSGTRERVAAVPVKEVDPVGAGNAYCGGFLAGWVQTGDLVEAARCGSVAASFVVEQVGVPPASAEVRAEARRRLRELSEVRA